jgi:hypothetical protein
MHGILGPHWKIQATLIECGSLARSQTYLRLEQSVLRWITAARSRTPRRERYDGRRSLPVIAEIELKSMKPFYACLEIVAT